MRMRRLIQHIEVHIDILLFNEEALNEATEEYVMRIPAFIPSNLKSF